MKKEIKLLNVVGLDGYTTLTTARQMKVEGNARVSRLDEEIELWKDSAEDGLKANQNTTLEDMAKIYLDLLTLEKDLEKPRAYVILDGSEGFYLLRLRTRELHQFLKEVE